MRLKKARVQNYRSIIDSGEFEIEELKTILVGPNEAGKTVLLKALQQLNKPNDIEGFDVLRDYPRSKYNDITTGTVDPKDIIVVTGYFELEEEDKGLIPKAYHSCKYKLYKNLDNKIYSNLIDAPKKIKFKDVKNNLSRMFSHMDKQFTSNEADEENSKPSELFKVLTSEWSDEKSISGQTAESLSKWLNDNYNFVEENNSKEEERHSKLLEIVKLNEEHDNILKILDKRTPVFILFNNYFRVKPSIHLDHLAKRVEQNILDDEYYDYGNLCLLKLLGFSDRELADLGNASIPDMNDKNALKGYKDKLDTRSYQLNAASVRLTGKICSAWMPEF